jgi:hypothetical protein
MVKDTAHATLSMAGATPGAAPRNTPDRSAKRDAIDYACQRFGGGAGAQQAHENIRLDARSRN